MAIKTAVLRIPRSEMHVITEEVPLWEVPLVEAIHNGVQTISTSVRPDRAAPVSTQAEYERLEARYRLARNDDGSFGLPLVAAVYGQHGVGISNLSRAIKEATVSDAAAAEALLA